MTLLGWVVWVFGAVLTVRALWMVTGRLAAWREIQRGWVQLRSGEWRAYGNGVDGFVSTHTQRPYWWIRRNETTVIEGYASTLDAAKLEVDGEAQWLVERR